MTRVYWHRLLVAVVIVLIVAAALFYLFSVTMAPQGPDVAERFVALAWISFVAAVGAGIVDFFVRFNGPRPRDDR
ncbi:hypothetical protein ACPEEZ_05530 [Frigoribacterium sp. 2-23]|uniref:hypothetical protein n=1 Tax=Frigoribacterium sp. 2-23 TaxID=3415006 RepID=UPI003C6FA07C